MRAVCGDHRLFIVDEAHGSHCYFSDNCPTPALKAGADAAIDSLHKTLGGIYGTSLINIGKFSKLDVDKIKMLHMMMASGSGDDISPFLLADAEGCIEIFASKDGENLVN